jgi:hypothetical protein
MEKARREVWSGRNGDVVAINASPGKNIGLPPGQCRDGREEHLGKRKRSRGMRRNAVGYHCRQVCGERLLALDINPRPVCGTVPGGLCLQRKEHGQQAHAQGQRVASHLRETKELHLRSKFTTVSSNASFEPVRLSPNGNAGPDYHAFGAENRGTGNRVVRRVEKVSGKEKKWTSSSRRASRREILSELSALEIVPAESPRCGL